MGGGVHGVADAAVDGVVVVAVVSRFKCLIELLND